LSPEPPVSVDAFQLRLIWLQLTAEAVSPVGTEGSVLSEDASTQGVSTNVARSANHSLHLVPDSPRIVVASNKLPDSWETSLGEVGRLAGCKS